MLHLFLMQFIEILLFLLNQIQLCREVFACCLYFTVLALQLFLPLVHVQLPLFQFRFDGLNLGVALCHLLLQIRLQVQELFLHLQQFVLLNHFRFLFSLFDDRF